MISSLNFALFPSNELLTFAKGTIAISESKKSQLPVIIPFLSNLTSKCDIYQLALERELKNPLTKSQVLADEARSDAFFSFRTYSESAASRRKEGWGVAAGNILSVIRKHGWSAQTWGYKAKSAAFSKIISEIKTKYNPDLKLIGGSELLDELTLAEVNFETLALQVLEVGSTTNEPTISTTRPELVTALKALFQITSLQEISAPSNDATALTESFNQLIITSLSTVKASDTKAENTKKASADTTK